MVVSKLIRSVEGLSVDWISKNLYFTDTSYGFISVVRLNSPSFSDRRNIITGLGNPRAIVQNPLVG